MSNLKEFELNNKVLEEFDTLMTYHLDQVEELTIKELSINPKLYNIISLCTNVKTLIIEGDLRVDINKIVGNLCKPELLENLVLYSVKLPTHKIVERLTNLHTISLNNVKFSDVKKFFNQIGNKNSVIALKLQDVDLKKDSINICGEFKNLQFLNIDNLSNCKFDDFSFLVNNSKLKRLSIQNILVSLDKINIFCKIKYRKNISINIETNEKCKIKNSFEIDDEKKSYLKLNIRDFEKAIDLVSLYKIDNFCLIVDENVELDMYLKYLKKIKNDVSIVVKDILYLDSKFADKLRDKVQVKYVSILESNYDFDLKYTYEIDEYINLRNTFEKVKDEFIGIDNDVEKFLLLCEYLKKNYKIVEDVDTDDLKEAIINHNCKYNIVAILMKSFLGLLNIDSKIIDGTIMGNSKNVKWNQVKLDDTWYNFDFASEMKSKSKKVKLSHILKTDNVFYSKYTPQSGEPELCDKIFNKELESDINKKSNIIKKVFSKLGKTRKKDESYDTK